MPTSVYCGQNNRGSLRIRCTVISLVLALSVSGCAKQSHTATLTWTPITKDTGGNTLTTVAGYKIHYGPSPKAMNTVEVLSNPKQTTYVVQGLHRGTWFFAVSAYTASGTESALSNVGSKTID